MDKETLKAEINSFCENANVGASDQKKLLRRLPDSINFMLSLGVGLDDIPNNDQIEQLRVYLSSLTYRKGKKSQPKTYEPGVVRDWVNRTVDFYNVRNAKRSVTKTTNEPQITIPDFEAAPVPDEQTHSTEISHTVCEDTTADNNDIPKGEHYMTEYDNSAVTAEAVQTAQPHPLSPVKASRKPGRPETTGRTEKFTLYMTPELWKKIRMLADLDEDNITDFMNIILENYCDNERSEDLEFLYSLERRKQERRLLKAKG